MQPIEKLIAESTNKQTVETDFKLKTADDTTKFETKYNYGRVTVVRNLKYYNLLVKSSKPFEDTKLRLSKVIAEWNVHDANIAIAQGGFIQKPLIMQDPEKNEME